MRKSILKTDNPESLKRSQRNLMLYLYGNFDVPFALMATLTYAEKVYDMGVTIKDFRKFRTKFRAMFPNAVWIAVYEYHEDGSTHIHFIFKNAPGANHKILTDMWGHGMAFITKFETEKIPYFCKKERLDMYPSGTKLYTKSLNCKMPTPVNMSVEKYENITKNLECVYSSAKTLYKVDPITSTAKPVNTFIYKKFKRKKEN